MKILKVEPITLEYYTAFSGYDGFTFYYDDKQKKYSVMNQKTLEATKPFLDGIYLSDFQLGAWTANYFVGRIDDKYYIVDADGNCFFEEDKPFVICRNVFVQADCKYVVNNELKKVFPSDGEKIEIYESEHYNFAVFLNDAKQYRVITAKGEDAYKCYTMRNPSTTIKLHSGKKEYTLGGLEDGYFVFYDDYMGFLNKNFEIIDTTVYISKYVTKLKDSLAGIFTYKSEPVYSSYLLSKVDVYRKHGNVEFIWANGNTYVFCDDRTEKYSYSISLPQLIGDRIYYRAGSTIFVLDLDGKEIARKHLEIEEAYKIRLLEELLEKQK